MSRATSCFTVALVTDTHLAPRADAFAENWLAARRWIESLRPDLVVHLGDISADGESEVEQLDAAAAAFGGLEMPLRFLPGNHDIGDSPSAAALAHYRRCFGGDRWALEAAGWQLIGLNAQLFGLGDAEEAEQFAWLEAQAATSDLPLGLMLHKPLPAPSADAAEVVEPGGRYVPSAAARRLRALLNPRALRFVICGHTHQAHHIGEGALQHVWVPSTSFCIPDAMQERIGDKRVGAMLLQLESGHYRLESVTPPGMSRHNLLHFPQVYPQVRAMRERLGEAAEL